MQKTQEADSEAGAKSDRVLRLEADRGVVQVELLQGFAQVGKVLADDRVETSEDERLGLLVAGQRALSGIGRARSSCRPPGSRGLT